MPRAGRDEDRIARADHATVAVEVYFARAFEDEIKFLRDLVIVPLCAASFGDARFREALVLDGRIRAIENRTDGRAVFRGKSRLGREILDGHGSNKDVWQDPSKTPNAQRSTSNAEPSEEEKVIRNGANGAERHRR
jgi:hypothetical protein